MTHRIDRRRFLTTTSAAAAGVGLAGWRPAPVRAEERLADGAPHAEKLGWRLGCQAYTFNRFTFYEAVQKNAAVGLKVIEAYPGQRLSDDGPEGNFGLGMSPEVRKAVLQYLADHDIELVNFGVVGLPNNEPGSRAVFEFAKDMGIETIVSEPEFEALDLIEDLADEYEINVALHNHPRPSRYWDPKTVLEQCEGRSERIGACADTGHWMRSDIEPVEAVKMLEGRIISFHFKDLNHYGGGAHDVPWGTGEADVPAILHECHRQGFQGVFAVEYEHNWLESLPEIAESVKFFDKVAAEILEG